MGVNVTAMLSFAIHTQYRYTFPTIWHPSRCIHTKTGPPYPKKQPVSDGQIGHIGSQTTVFRQGRDLTTGRNGIKRMRNRAIAHNGDKHLRYVLFLQKLAKASTHDILPNRNSSFTSDNTELDYTLRCVYSKPFQKTCDTANRNVMSTSYIHRSVPHSARWSARLPHSVFPHKARILRKPSDNEHCLVLQPGDGRNIAVHQQSARYNALPNGHRQLHARISNLVQLYLYLSEIDKLKYSARLSPDPASAMCKLPQWQSIVPIGTSSKFESTMKATQRERSTFGHVFNSLRLVTTASFPAYLSSRHQPTQSGIVGGKYDESRQSPIKRFYHSTSSAWRKSGFMRTSSMQSSQLPAPSPEPSMALGQCTNSDNGTRPLQLTLQPSNRRSFTSTSSLKAMSSHPIATTSETGMTSEDTLDMETSSTENRCDGGTGTILYDDSESKKQEDEERDEEEEEEHIPLPFQIPPETLRAAIQAPTGTQGSFWSQTLYRGPDDKMLLVHYTRSMEVSEKVAKYFLEEDVLGFDIEWKPNALPHIIKDNVSLIQIASGDRIALFHIAQHKGKTVDEILSPTLRRIIESPDILKVGVAVKADFTRVRRYLGLEPRGVFEISRLHNQVVNFGTDRQNSRVLVSLANQIQQHLVLPLFKGNRNEDGSYDDESVRVSDWSAVLQKDQIEYAASDAYAGLRLFDILESKRKRLRPAPARPQVCDNDKPVKKKPTKTTKKDAAKSKAEQENVNKPTNVEDEESEEESYVTAEEDMADTEQSEPESPASESASSSADEGSDPDADYVPPTKMFQQLSIDSKPRASPRRGGRATQSTAQQLEQDSSSDSSDAFDTPIPRSKRASVAKATDVPMNPLPSTLSKADDPVPETPNSSPTPPQYTLASQWASSHLDRTIPDPKLTTRSERPSRIRATLPPLRAYHMWHHQRLPLTDIAGLLREPPLAMSTVCNYIAQAVALESLEYDAKEMREVLDFLPAGLKEGRWKSLVRKVEGGGGVE